MTEGYNEYYLCGDRTLESEVRDQVLTKQSFKTPPEYLRNRMAEIAEILKATDPYYVSVFASEDDIPFNYRAELFNAFTKEQLFALEELGFNFESVGPRGQTVTIWLKEGLKR